MTTTNRAKLAVTRNKGGRTLSDIRDAQREEAKRLHGKRSPDARETARKLDEWADDLDRAIENGKDLLG